MHRESSTVHGSGLHYTTTTVSGLLYTTTTVSGLHYTTTVSGVLMRNTDGDKALGQSRGVMGNHRCGKVFKLL